MVYSPTRLFLCIATRVFPVYRVPESPLTLQTTKSPRKSTAGAVEGEQEAKSGKKGRKGAATEKKSVPEASEARESSHGGEEAPARGKQGAVTRTEKAVALGNRKRGWRKITEEEDTMGDEGAPVAGTSGETAGAGVAWVELGNALKQGICTV